MTPNIEGMTIANGTGNEPSGATKTAGNSPPSTEIVSRSTCIAGSIVPSGVPSLRTLPQDLRTFARYHLVRRSVDYPARESALGIAALEFDFDDYIASLRSFATAEPTPFAIETAADLPYQGRDHSSLILRSPPTSGPRLLVLAGVHGNEHAGLLAVVPILEAFGQRTDEVGLTVIAPVNPVGAAQLSRYNADGYDVNRDFVRFETTEARVVRDAIASERPRFIASLHEGPQDATFMFTNRQVSGELAARLASALAAGGTELATVDYFGRTLRPAGIAPMNRPTWLLSKLWAGALKMKATGLYADELGIPEITLESSWRDPDPSARVRAHVDLVAAILDCLS